jgi:hypothetical protein
LNWVVLFTPTAKRVKIGGEIGYCTGDPRPKILKPDMTYDDDNVSIKLEARVFPHRGQGLNGLCAGKELVLSRTIRLPRKLSELKLYDSGFEPPKQVWPQ